MARMVTKKKRVWRAGELARVVHGGAPFDVAHVSPCPESGASLLWSADDGRARVASFCERVDEARHVNESPGALGFWEPIPP